MKPYLPYFFKKVGIVFVLIAIILSMISGVNDFRQGFEEGYRAASHSELQGVVQNDSESEVISPELVKTLTWISLACSFSGFLLYMFSREKMEDEFIQKLRLMALAKSLLLTWITASVLFVINGDLKLEGFYILQFQLIVYVMIYNYYKKWKFDSSEY